VHEEAALVRRVGATLDQAGRLQAMTFFVIAPDVTSSARNRSVGRRA
jgi:hypothetical protein